jgi:hypothetical protein
MSVSVERRAQTPHTRSAKRGGYNAQGEVQKRETAPADAIPVRTVYLRCGKLACHCMKLGGKPHQYRYKSVRDKDARVVTTYGGKP